MKCLPISVHFFPSGPDPQRKWCDLTENLQESVDNAVSRLLSWLLSWKTEAGAYHGFVVHRHDLKRMWALHDTPWSQSGVIEGFLELHKRTGCNRCLREAEQAASLQAKRLRECRFIYAGLEDDRFSSLVHNALADSTLIDAASSMHDHGRGTKADKLIQVATDNVEGYLIPKLLDRKVGAFKFAEFDYYSPDKTRFVANMNSVVAEVLAKLYFLTNHRQYIDLASRVGEWLQKQISLSGPTRGQIQYSDKQHSIYVSLYTALALRGLDDLHLLTGSNRYLMMTLMAAKALLALMDPKTGLFLHGFSAGRRTTYPIFIAGSGMIFRAIHDAELLTHRSLISWEDCIRPLLRFQNPSGGFESFLGYDTEDNIRPRASKVDVWENRVPTVCWNAQLFAFLTRFVSSEFQHSHKSHVPETFLTGPAFAYSEDERRVGIVCSYPPRSAIVYLAKKKMDHASLYFSPLALGRRLMGQSLMEYMKGVL